MKFGLLIATFFFVTSVATAQIPQISVSACDLLGAKGLEKKNAKAARELLQLKCELEKAELRKQIREADKETRPSAGDAIGVASKNRSVTTVTYRDNTGKALEGSKDWARHEEKMADINRKKEVGVEKAKNPGCGWFGCYTPVGYGMGYGGGYYGGGGVHIVSTGPVGSNLVYRTR